MWIDCGESTNFSLVVLKRNRIKIKWGVSYVLRSPAAVYQNKKTVVVLKNALSNFYYGIGEIPC